MSLKSTPSLSSEFLDTSLSPLEAQRRDILLSNMGTFQSRKVLMERHAQSSMPFLAPNVPVEHALIPLIKGVSMYKNELSNVSSRKPHSVELSDRELYVVAFSFKFTHAMNYANALAPIRSHRLLGEKTLSQDQKQTLDYHRKLQDNLTNELAKGASRLKENTSQFTDLLKKDREVFTK